MKATSAGQPADAAPSLRDSLSEAFDAADAPASSAPSTPEPASAEPAAPDAPAPAVEAGSEAESAAAAPAEGAGDRPADVPAADKPAADAPRTPPGFPGGDTAWAALPAEARSWVKAREQQVEKWIRTNAEAVKFGGQMYGAVRPYEAMIRAQGLHPAQVVAASLNQHYALQAGSPEQKAQVILGLAQQYGVDLSSAIDQQASAPQPNPEIQQLRQAYAGLARYLRANEEQQANMMMNAATSHVAQFASDSQRPYMRDPRVLNRMATLIDSGEAQSLEDAYDQAAHSFKDIRAVLLEGDAARRAQAAREAVAQAPARGGAPVAANMAPVKSESLRATLSRAFDDPGSRHVA